jgi:LacI family transcriptional regulator|tara:strand:- start:1227 stop:2288 length:1062 start_codon:yes stop_codon:yes gene_type:complete
MARVNQQIIAQRLNLSQTTVSRALGNHPAINADTKAIVWNLAAQLGYQMPPPRARLSSGKEPCVIGVLIAIPERQRGHAETSQEVLRGIAERSSSDVVTLDVVYHEPSDHDPKAIQRRIRQSRWRGAILVHPMTDEVVETISKTIPCVSVVENYRRNYIDSVDVDQIDSVNFLVKALHEQGHRKIGFLSWVYDVPTPWVHHRFGSYVESLYLFDLEFDPTRVINLRPAEQLTVIEVAEKTAELVREGVTAFVCAADHQAYELRQLLAERGIQVPRDCSLTGFDGIEPTTGVPAMATVRVPYDEIGRSAFHQLMRRVDHPLAPRRHVLVDGEFVEGTSIGPPNGSAAVSAVAKH